ncbi:MAG: DUF2384 domain-containing protein [Bryobacterales bacterium]|nr:DUF2384 domain-containing protein [Bryobacterales bacterium]
MKQKPTVQHSQGKLTKTAKVTPTDGGKRKKAHSKNRQETARAGRGSEIAAQSADERARAPYLVFQDCEGVLGQIRDLISSISRGPEVTAQSVEAHALETFGSAAKAEHWLNRPNPLFQGQTPRQVIQANPSTVEAALVRIDHGVYT